MDNPASGDLYVGGDIKAFVQANNGRVAGSQQASQHDGRLTRSLQRRHQRMDLRFSRRVVWHDRLPAMRFDLSFSSLAIIPYCESVCQSPGGDLNRAAALSLTKWCWVSSAPKRLFGHVWSRRV